MIKCNTPGKVKYDSYVGKYDLIGLKDNRRFSVLKLGDGIPRENDTEAKFFEFDFERRIYLKRFHLK